MLEKYLETLLAIESPTYKEQEFVKYVKQRLETKQPSLKIREFEDCLIIEFPYQKNKPHISLIGHSDVVPTHFQPYIKQGHLHGSGASDMKGAIAAYLQLFEDYGEALLDSYNLSCVIYSREERTSIEINGLYHLLQQFPDYFKSIDLAIIGEPTDNTIQIGCVGGIHAVVTIPGLACHSARPWNGTNAIYEALPLMNALAKLNPVKHTVFEVDFFDCIELTECESEMGRTSIPGWWKGNINFRFAPIRNEEQALNELNEFFKQFGIHNDWVKIIDSVPAGSVIETDVFKLIVNSLKLPIVAKQAWTDVAQLTAKGIPAFNYGPGLTSQAHKENEYIVLKDLNEYYESLKQLFLR